MRETFAGAHIEKVHGIVNGTTNYILSEMARTGASYTDALGRAQELGYAEADPTDDVTGKDAAAKMAILARLAFHTPVYLDQVPYEGIEEITANAGRDFDPTLARAFADVFRADAGLRTKLTELRRS